MRNVLVLSLLGAAAIAASAPAAAHPRPGIWVAYRSIFGSGSSVPIGTPDGGFGVVHSHGRYPIFSVRLASRVADEPLVAQVVSPGGYDRVALNVRDLDAEHSGNDAHSRQTAALSLLERLIAHHRPAITLQVARSGDISVIGSPALTRYERCARRLLEQASQAVIAAAPQPLREVELRRRELSVGTARLPLAGPSLLLSMIRLRLPAVSNGRWSATQRRMSENAGPNPAADQFWWASEQIRLHGREAGVEIDLMSATDGLEARICRSLSLDTIGVAVADRCSIGGFIDRRDGWPITITVSRTMRAADRAEANRNVNFTRLAPLEGFVPPPDPCATRSEIRTSLRS